MCLEETQHHVDGANQVLSLYHWQNHLKGDHVTNFAQLTKKELTAYAHYESVRYR